MCINENIFKFNELGLLPPGCHEYVCFKKMQLKFSHGKNLQ